MWYMETLKYTAVLALLLSGNFLIGNVLSWALTEWKRPVFNFKPFNCRPCLSFWLTSGTGAVVALWYGFDHTSRAAILALAVLLGLINYIIINSKIQIHE